MSNINDQNYKPYKNQWKRNSILHIKQTSSGFSMPAVIPLKLISGATDNPTPWYEINLRSPICFSTWKQLCPQENWSPSENVTNILQCTWSGGGMISWHSNARGYTCPGTPEWSKSLLMLSTEDESKGAWPLYISTNQTQWHYIEKQ